MDWTSMSTEEYLSTPETTRPRELAYSVVREPPAPYFTHQEIVFRTARLIHDHVARRGLGRIALAPVDVVLDRQANLVVQPDVLFVAAARTSIIRDQVWGAPDLVGEVLSLGTKAHDRVQKLAWYRQYGVREYWLVDPFAEQVTVVSFAGVHPEQETFERHETVVSTLLPEFHAVVQAFFV